MNPKKFEGRLEALEESNILFEARVKKLEELLGIQLECRFQAAEDTNRLLRDRVQKLEERLKKEEKIEPTVNMFEPLMSRTSAVIVPPEFTPSPKKRTRVTPPILQVTLHF
jgi:hypothetical protein